MTTGVNPITERVSVLRKAEPWEADISELMVLWGYGRTRTIEIVKESGIAYRQTRHKLFVDRQQAIDYIPHLPYRGKGSNEEAL